MPNLISKLDFKMENEEKERLNIAKQKSLKKL